MKIELTPFEERALRKLVRLENNNLCYIKIIAVYEDCGEEEVKTHKFSIRETEDLFSALNKLLESGEPNE